MKQNTTIIITIDIVPYRKYTFSFEDEELSFTLTDSEGDFRMSGAEIEVADEEEVLDGRVND